MIAALLLFGDTKSTFGIPQVCQKSRVGRALSFTVPGKRDFGIHTGMTTLAIEKMTVSEKLLAMEQLWDDLCRRAELMQSPDWHGEVLMAREERVQYGTSQFSDWKEAKKRIQDRTS